MDFANIFGWCASICMILGYLPQAVVTIRTRDTDGIAMPTFIMMGLGSLVFNSEFAPTAEQWARQVSLEERYLNKGTIGLGYIQRVQRTKFSALERRMRSAGYPGFNAPSGRIVTVIPSTDFTSAASATSASGARCGPSTVTGIVSTVAFPPSGL